ncbi:excinuclease ABC subunit UvrC [Halothiobacillus neapolitanus]|uniref:UvrABC system protein C n=1 Tax=Halothiobacillus neapolitanus (strain ATCC 23641 / DSM 15147 / CIP 104769 / NCIMB 8539 / c2) TaxID=555778 RepID=D0L1Q3_HALNC|nr:excinuclease ABC subunit UvrC [Halothiobacillus neapolitanus]ACX96626.1 excinuclease ABC, C subunit [Halothiobacillus neapolitanus c2]TDN65264.1 excinuclease ABC subunit C [Halothiobacillus neapolitanus]
MTDQSVDHHDSEISPVFDAARFLKSVTERPGIYRMYGEDDVILYIGKARNLKARLSSYFRGQQAIKTQALVRQIVRIEITATQTEAEALLLESNLIKAHRPRYNILLRDDKSYPWIYVSTDQDYPRLAYHRGARKRKGCYFGPYSAPSAVRETLNLLEKVFKVRQCEDSVFRNRSRPCLQYQIGRCTAPCVGFISPEAYRQDVDDTMAFLSGRSQILTEQLAERMAQAAAALDFEQAAQLRDQISQLRVVAQQQSITGVNGDADVIALIMVMNLTVVAVSTIRDGRHLGTRSYFPQVPADTEPAETMAGFISQYYAEREAPVRVLCSPLPQDVAFLSDGLSNAVGAQTGRRVTFTTPQRGKAREWLEQTAENARLAAQERLASRIGLETRFAALRAVTGLSQIQRIECFDISHTQGELTVASCVVFGVEGAQKDQYRRYSIEGITPGDDYAAMHQALTRRFARAQREGGILPDVLLIDGGAGQVAQAQAVLSALAIDSVYLLGVAKGVARRAGEERLIRPKTSTGQGGEETRLDPHDPALHLIQQVRDEAHRFAITGHRARRQKARTQSDLEKIPGVGAKRRQALLTHFGGMRGLRHASVAELAKVPGISMSLAEGIQAWLHEGADVPIEDRSGPSQQDQTTQDLISQDQVSQEQTG